MKRKLWLLLVLVLGVVCVGAAFAEDVTVMSHAEYIAAEIDSPVCVETYVQATQSWWDSKISIYAQSPDGAYFIYNASCTEENAARLTPGTKIRVTGYKSEWAGETEIVDPVLEILEGDTFVAQPFDATSLLGTEDLIGHQNELVSFTGLTVEPQDDGSAFSYKDPVNQTDDLYLTVSKDGKVYNFCVEYYLCGNDTEVYRAVEGLRVGDVIDVEAFLYWYNGVNPHCVRVTKAEGPEPEIIASGECGENVTWTLDSEGLLTVSGTGEMTDHPWTAAEVKRVVIEEGVTSICDGAFEECGSLESISIADTVTAIGRYAFQRCASLTEIDLPAGVTAVGDNTFTHCIALTGVTIPESVTSLGSYAFAYCTELKELVLPDSLKIIGDSCFECTPLETVNIPDGVTGIGRYTFFESALTQATVPDGVTSIGPCAFGFCSSLTSVTLPDSLTSIADTAFQACALTDVYYAGTEEQWAAIEIGEENAPLTGANIHFNADGPAAPEIIASGECGENLTWTLDEDGLLTISGTGAMRDYSSASDTPWFAHRASIRSAAIEDGVTGIGNNAFSGCGSLASVKIPAEMTSVGDYAFCECPSLADVYYGGTEAQWQEILISDQGNDALYNATIHYTTTDPEEIAASGKCGSDVTWKLTARGFLTISGEGEMTNYSPTGNAPWYEMRTTIYGVQIEGSVTSIGNFAFNGCNQISGIGIPDSVTRIGNYAFNNCSYISTAYISDSVQSIGEHAFGNCSILEQVINMSGVTNIGNYAFHNCTRLSSFTAPGSVTKIGSSAFMNCSSLTDVTISNPETVIGSGSYDVFTGCSPALTIHGWTDSTAQTYAAGADIPFESLGALSGQCGDDVYWSLDPAAGRVSITGSGPMWDYSPSETASPFTGSVISSAVIGSGVTSIGNYAFHQCENLTAAELPGTLMSIGDNAFSSSYNLRSITIPNGVISIGNGAFQYCRGLSSEIIIPDSVTSIGERAFESCSIIKRVTIGNSIPSIGTAVFNNCWQLASVTIGNSVTSIGDNAFSGTGLTEVTIPANVTSIGNECFSSCRDLSNAFIYNPDVTFGAYAFNFYYDGVTMKLPMIHGFEGSTAQTFASANNLPFEILKTPNMCGENVTWTLDENGLLTISGTGDMYDYGRNNFAPYYEYAAQIKETVVEPGVSSIGDYAFYGLENMTSATLPETLTDIGMNAFNFCYSLPSVTIPEGVTQIGMSAFYGCTSLEQAELPESLRTIEREAFHECYSLRSVYIPENVSAIEIFAFSNCRSLESADVAEGNLYYCSQDGVLFDRAKTTVIRYPSAKAGSRYEIPDTVTVIGANAFDYCTHLTEIIIPDGVTEIGYYAFEGCSGLTAGIELPEGLLTIGHDLFAICRNLQSAVIPDKVTVIPYRTFAHCESLQRVYLPAGLTEIEESAFFNCAGLTDVYFGGTEAEWAAVEINASNNDPLFAAAIHFEGEVPDPVNILTLPAGLTAIESEAFAGLETADGIRIPASVTNIADDAFNGSDITILAPEGSYALEWARTHRVPFIAE